MKIVILNGIDTPIYEQVFQQISTQILDGTLKPNESLPSIRNIARQVGISIITVKKAWEMLEQNGLIYTQAGKGCFVASNATQNKSQIALQLAVEQLKKELPYYKKLSLTKKEFLEIIGDLFDKI